MSLITFSHITKILNVINLFLSTLSCIEPFKIENEHHGCLLKEMGSLACKWERLPNGLLFKMFRLFSLLQLKTV